MDFRPSRGRGSDSLCVKMLGQSPVEQVFVADVVQWQAIPGVSIPVSGFGASPEVLPCSTMGVIPPEVRSSYGGGFSALESTAWKGTDRSDIQTLCDRASSLLPRQVEPAQPSPHAPVPGVMGGGTPSSLTQHLRPPSEQSVSHPLIPPVSNLMQITGEVPSSAEGNQVCLSPSRIRCSSTAAAATAVKVRRSPPGDRLPGRLSSSSSTQLRHPVLHGPSERRRRPHSAASPLQACSVQSNQDKTRKKHETSRYGSAIFDG